MNRILESAKLLRIIPHVKTNSKEVNNFCEYFNHEHIKHWFNESPFDIRKLNPKDRLQLLLVFNSVSFSYWGDPKWKIQYNGEELDGIWNDWSYWQGYQK